MVHLPLNIPYAATGRKSEKAIKKAMSPGNLLHLREGVYRQLKERDWVFNKRENDTVFLIHSSRAYGIAVRTGDIDWDVPGLSRP